ncbi:hypothetical protein I6F26_14625 [Ensifer sp. IC3342]|nr:hypothetical protein [Ensifer sp. BRP08]MCA1447814.1 hypothetical protein [Ensifer sp. IC3342]
MRIALPPHCRLKSEGSPGNAVRLFQADKILSINLNWFMFFLASASIQENMREAQQRPVSLSRVEGEDFDKGSVRAS